MGMFETNGGREAALARTVVKRGPGAADSGAVCVADWRYRSNADAGAEVVPQGGGRGINRVTEDRINTGDLSFCPQGYLLFIRHLEPPRTSHVAARSDSCPDDRAV